MEKVLVVVAHPDDEILWMGGNLIKHRKDWNATVVVLCRASDKDREPKFRRVCKELGVKGFIFDLDDEKLEPLPVEEYTSILAKFAGSYDKIFTHGENGEYGHVRHLDIHNAVKSMIGEGKLKAKEILFFSYHKVSNDHQGYAVYNSNADIFIKLNRDELAMKKKLAIDVYGYDRGGIGFEENSCRDVEAFDKFER